MAEDVYAKTGGYHGVRAWETSAQGFPASGLGGAWTEARVLQVRKWEIFSRMRAMGGAVALSLD